MITIGSTIQAQAVDLEPYGAWFQHGPDRILVLVPELSWRSIRHPQEVVRVGDFYAMRILRFNDRAQAFAGSIRALHPEESPYRQLSAMPAGLTLPGKIVTVFPDEYTVELANGAWGKLPRASDTPTYQSGEIIQVSIAKVDGDRDLLILRLDQNSLDSVAPAVAGQPHGHDLAVGDLV